MSKTKITNSVSDNTTPGTMEALERRVKKELLWIMASVVVSMGIALMAGELINF